MEDKKLDKIVSILIEEINPKKLILFGSRGKETATFNSDYDIAIDSEKIDLNSKRNLIEKIDEVIGLNKIDLVFLNSVDSGFREVIYNTGKVIYEQ
jgi:predicted nucleotidyltransferase